MSSIEDWACNYLVASLFILDLLHCAPKSICQIQFVHKMEAGQKIVAITRHILTLEQVLYLDMCYIRTSLTFGRVLRLDKCYIWQVLHLDKCYTFGQVLHIWTSVTLGHVLMHCNGKVGFQHAQTHWDGGDSAIGLCKNPTCAFLLSARIEMCKDVLRNQWTRPECSALHWGPKIVLVLSSSFHQPVRRSGTGQWRLYCDWIARIAPQLSSNGFQIAQTSSGWQFCLSLSGLQFPKCAATPITGLPQ